MERLPSPPPPLYLNQPLEVDLDREDELQVVSEEFDPEPIIELASTALRETAAWIRGERPALDLGDERPLSERLSELGAQAEQVDQIEQRLLQTIVSTAVEVLAKNASHGRIVRMDIWNQDISVAADRLWFVWVGAAVESDAFDVLQRMREASRMLIAQATDPESRLQTTLLSWRAECRLLNPRGQLMRQVSVEIQDVVRVSSVFTVREVAESLAKTTTSLLKDACAELDPTERQHILDAHSELGVLCSAEELAEHVMQRFRRGEEARLERVLDGLYIATFGKNHVHIAGKAAKLFKGLEKRDQRIDAIIKGMSGLTLSDGQLPSADEAVPVLLHTCAKQLCARLQWDWKERPARLCVWIGLMAAFYPEMKSNPDVLFRLAPDLVIAERSRAAGKIFHHAVLSNVQLMNVAKQFFPGHADLENRIKPELLRLCAQEWLGLSPETLAPEMLEGITASKAETAVSDRALGLRWRVYLDLTKSRLNTVLIGEYNTREQQAVATELARKAAQLVQEIRARGGVASTEAVSCVLEQVAAADAEAVVSLDALGQLLRERLSEKQMELVSDRPHFMIAMRESIGAAVDYLRRHQQVAENFQPYARRVDWTAADKPETVAAHQLATYVRELTEVMGKGIWNILRKDLELDGATSSWEQLAFKERAAVIELIRVGFGQIEWEGWLSELRTRSPRLSTILRTRLQQHEQAGVMTEATLKRLAQFEQAPTIGVYWARVTAAMLQLDWPSQELPLTFSVEQATQWKDTLFTALQTGLEAAALQYRTLDVDSTLGRSIVEQLQYVALLKQLALPTSEWTGDQQRVAQHLMNHCMRISESAKQAFLKSLGEDSPVTGESAEERLREYSLLRPALFDPQLYRSILSEMPI